MSFKVYLRDVAEFQKGFAFKSKDYVDKGIKIVKVSNLTADSIDISQCVCIENNFAKKYITKYDLNTKDIIITTVGSWPTNPASVVGKVVRVPKTAENTLLNQNAVRVRGNERVVQDYLYYLLKDKNFMSYIVGTAQGSANQASITQEDIKNFSFYLPSLVEQKAIANILLSLDDKIELNNQMNETLEEMAQALFKRWFVDFEFPNEEGQPYKSSGGQMIESELGMIPKGWDVTIIKEFGEVITGKTPSTKVKDNYGDKYPFITIPDMHNNIFVLNTERYLSQLGNDAQPKKLIPSNSLIVSCIATVGLVAINSQDSHTNQQINSLIVNDIKKLYYLYFALKGQSEYLNLLGSSGTTTKNVNKSVFEKIKIINPEQKLINEYHKICKPIFEGILENMKQNNYLKETRDSLLSKLISGEIRVNDLEG